MQITYAFAWIPSTTGFSEALISHMAPKRQAMEYGISFIELATCLKMCPDLQHIQETQHIHKVLAEPTALLQQQSLEGYALKKKVIFCFGVPFCCLEAGFLHDISSLSNGFIACNVCQQNIKQSPDTI